MQRATILSTGLALCLMAGRAQAQQSAVRVLIISPSVGPVIDQKEKTTYGLFPYYSADDFVEASFEQRLSADSTIELRTQLRDGRAVRRTFSPEAYTAVRTTIETRQQQPNSLLTAPKAQLGNLLVRPLFGGRWLRAELRSGAVVEGELLARYRRQVELLTLDSGLVVVKRADLMQVEPIPRPAQRATDRFSVGNGHRQFLVPTARNLRRGEGYLQQIVGGLLLGGSYGFTNYFSLGVLFSALPILPVRSQFLLVMPKLSAKLSDKWHIGGGVMYTRIPKLDEEVDKVRVGIGYGLVTYGSADDNVSVGLGYAINKAGIRKTPVLHYGAQKRISRDWSLVAENFVLIHNEPGLLGLFGVRYGARRFSLSLGGGYTLPFHGFEDAFVGPAYLDLAYRFGKGSR